MRRSVEQALQLDPRATDFQAAGDLGLPGEALPLDLRSTEQGHQHILFGRGCVGEETSD